MVNIHVLCQLCMKSSKKVSSLAKEFLCDELIFALMCLGGDRQQ